MPVASCSAVFSSYRRGRRRRRCSWRGCSPRVSSLRAANRPGIASRARSEPGRRSAAAEGAIETRTSRSGSLSAGPVAAQAPYVELGSAQWAARRVRICWRRLRRQAFLGRAHRAGLDGLGRVELAERADGRRDDGGVLVLQAAQERIERGRVLQFAQGAGGGGADLGLGMRQEIRQRAGGAGRLEVGGGLGQGRASAALDLVAPLASSPLRPG